MTDFGLEGRVAIVTGSSQGIGAETARGLARERASVVLASRNPEENRRLAAEIVASGGQAVPVILDVTDLSSIQAMVDQVVGTLGRIDILVNNAAWTATVPALDTTEEEWDRTIDTSLKGVFFCCQRVGRVMAGQGGGSIINLGSTLGKVVFANRAVYAAAKGGVHQLTKAFALELGPQGVRVNAVAPCLTETPTRDNLFDDEDFVSWAKSMLPIGRWAQPGDMLGPILFLASDLSAMVTGHVLMVDGGWTIQ